MILGLTGNEMAVRGGALGHFGDARRATMGTTLVERVVETGSLVIRKLGGTRAREIAIHRFLSAPSVTCGEMVETLAYRTAGACHKHIRTHAQLRFQYPHGQQDRHHETGPIPRSTRRRPIPPLTARYTKALNSRAVATRSPPPRRGLS